MINAKKELKDLIVGDKVIAIKDYEGDDENSSFTAGEIFTVIDVSSYRAIVAYKDGKRVEMYRFGDDIECEYYCDSINNKVPLDTWAIRLTEENRQIVKDYFTKFFPMIKGWLFNKYDKYYGVHESNPFCDSAINKIPLLSDAAFLQLTNNTLINQDNDYEIY
jgi:hypothetical protein